MFFRAAPAPTVEEEEEALPPGALPTAGIGAPTAPTEGAPGALPEADQVARGGVTQTTVLTTTSVTGVTRSSDGDGMNFYDDESGQFFTITADGSVEALSEEEFPDVESVSWSDGGDMAVLEFPDGSNIVYNFDTETQVTLPSHWEDFAFTDSDDIVAKSIGIDPGNRALVISNPDGSQVQAIQALGENADKVQVNPSPTEQIVAFSDTGAVQAGFGRKMIIPIGQEHENFKGLIVEGFGFQSLWSPRGDTLLYSVYGETSDYKPQLWVVDGSTNTIGDDRRSIGIFTWVDKCTFTDNTTVYCAVPRSLQANAGLQRVLVATEPDDLYRIDLGSGRASLVARPEDDAPMQNLFVTTDGSTLYYTHGLTGRLQSIRLE
jgi:hypothetical protein